MVQYLDTSSDPSLILPSIWTRKEATALPTVYVSSKPESDEDRSPLVLEFGKDEGENGDEAMELLLLILLLLLLVDTPNDTFLYK